MREYWLVHPTDRIVTGYRLEHGRYGVPEIRELQGRQSVGVLPEAEIDWELVAGLLGP